MKKQITALLLKTINDDGNIKKLRHYGLTYRQIGDLIEENIANGNLNGIEDVVSLTERGKEYLLANRELIKERDKSKWIELDLKNKTQPIDKEFIFLPSRNELSFLK